MFSTGVLSLPPLEPKTCQKEDPPGWGGPCNQLALSLFGLCGDVRCVLQCVAVCCSVLQCVVVWCSVLQRRAHSPVGQSLCDDVRFVLQCVAVCCSVLQCVAVCCSVLQCVAMRLHVRQFALYTHISLRVYIQKSPTHTQKSPTHTQKSPTHGSLYSKEPYTHNSLRAYKFLPQMRPHIHANASSHPMCHSKCVLTSNVNVGIHMWYTHIQCGYTYVWVSSHPRECVLTSNVPQKSTYVWVMVCLWCWLRGVGV